MSSFWLSALGRKQPLILLRLANMSNLEFFAKAKGTKTFKEHE
jgi:hypothetical protein